MNILDTVIEYISPLEGYKSSNKCMALTFMYCHCQLFSALWQVMAICSSRKIYII